MKNIVVEFFQNLPESKPEQFNKAFELYRQTLTKSHSVERVLNVSGYSETALNNLLYDLQKLHDISDVEKLPIEQTVLAEKDERDERIIILELLVKLYPVELTIWLDALTETEFNLELLLEYSISVNDDAATDILKEIIEKSKAITTIDANFKIVKNDDVINENENLKIINEDLLNENEDLQEENVELKNQLEESSSLPKITTQSIRTEFPFLNDVECPNELKILVADKITVWNQYLKLQEEISNLEEGKNNLDKEQLEKLAKRAVELFEENQKIYEELNAFKETGKVLGKHPIFRTLQLAREVEKMTLEEKIKYKNNSSKFFSVNKKDLTQAVKVKDTKKIDLLQERIAERTEKLALVNKSIGV